MAVLTPHQRFAELTVSAKWMAARRCCRGTGEFDCCGDRAQLPAAHDASELEFRPQCVTRCLCHTLWNAAASGGLVVAVAKRTAQDAQ